MYSFEMNKVTQFPSIKTLALVPLHKFFIQMYLSDEVAVIADCSKISLAKETVHFISIFLPNLPIRISRNPSG